MDDSIGAFIQRAVIKTFGLPQFMPNTEPNQPPLSQPNSMIECWPQSPKAADLRRSHEDWSDTDISKHPNKLVRSASRLDCRDCPQGTQIPPSVQEEATSPYFLHAKDDDFQRPPWDAEEELDTEPHSGGEGSQSPFSGASNDTQPRSVVLDGASSFSPCPEQESPQRSACLKQENIFEEDAMCTNDSIQDTPLISGPTRILTVNNNGRDRLAMLITDDMVATFNEIKEANEDLEKTAKELKAAEKEARDLSIDIKGAEEQLSDIQVQDDAEDIKRELEKLQLKLHTNERRQYIMKCGMRCSENIIRYSTEEFQNLFAKVLQEAAQVGQDSQDTHPQEEKINVKIYSEQHSGQAPNTPSDSPSQSGSGSASDSESSLLSPEDLLRQSATEDLDQSLWVLMDAQAKFDDRHAEYKRELANYNQLIAMGRISDTRTDFDIHSIQFVQGLTTRLRDAENRYEAAKWQAKALGVSVNPYDDDVFGDGYRGSQEVSLVAKVDRAGIEMWALKVATAKHPAILDNYDSTLVDIDEWNPKPVDTTESCSVVDFQGYGEDIKVWQKHCDVLREQAIQFQPDDKWSMAFVPMKRRRSI